MKFAALALLVLLPALIGSGYVPDELHRRATKKPSSCTPKYAALEHSTMCDFEDDPTATKQGVSEGHKKLIIDQHNRHRREVKPTPSDMQVVVWDEEMALIAQKYANVCVTKVMSHDTGEQRTVPGYGIFVNQNLAWGQLSWAEAIQAWYDEIKDWTYGQGKTGPATNPIGHFTLVVSQPVSRIGCGYAYCPKQPYPDPHKHTYVCNYAPGSVNRERPYKSGEACASCPNKCKNGLCDCGGHTCFNGGTIDVATCKCKCKNEFKGDSCQTAACDGKVCKNGGTLDPDSCACKCYPAWKGDACEILSCPMFDPRWCTANVGPSKCTQWRDIPGQCPYMCGVCQSNGTCPVDYDPAKCYRSWDKTKCKYSNVFRDCPYMCGNCKNPCPSITEFSDGYCVNGKLNRDSCKCECNADFKGTRCDVYKTCPKKEDPWWCSQYYAASSCSPYNNLPKDCPYMCKTCL